MNEIFSVNNKNELEDYKLIYPNDKKLRVNLSDGLTSASLKFGNETVKLNFLKGYLTLISCSFLNMIVTYKCNLL